MAYENKKVEELLKNPLVNSFSKEDWKDLALACADQADVNADSREMIDNCFGYFE